MCISKNSYIVLHAKITPKQWTKAIIVIVLNFVVEVVLQSSVVAVIGAMIGVYDR